MNKVEPAGQSSPRPIKSGDRILDRAIAIADRSEKILAYSNECLCGIVTFDDGAIPDEKMTCTQYPPYLENLDIQLNRINDAINGIELILNRVDL